MLLFDFRFLLLILLSIFFIPGFAIAGDQINSIINLKIPHFNESGYLAWELQTSKLSPKTKNIFLSEKPILYLYSDQNLETVASSDSCEFFREQGMALGKQKFEVSGKGFSASGNDWRWKSLTDLGKNQFIFNEKGYVEFDNGLGGFFSLEDYSREATCSSSTPDNKKFSKKVELIPTIANANYLEFLSVDEDSHRFLLDGNVSISGNNLFIQCEKMEVFFAKENNSTTSPVGEISKMYAFGNVVLKQEGRVSFGDQLTIDVKTGEAVLLGQLAKARVVDDEWGELSGEKIILEKGNRVARVTGGENVRPRLELPALPDLGFSKKKKKVN